LIDHTTVLDVLEVLLLLHQTFDKTSVSSKYLHMLSIRPFFKSSMGVSQDNQSYKNRFGKTFASILCALHHLFGMKRSW